MTHIYNNKFEIKLQLYQYLLQDNVKQEIENIR